MLNVHLVKVIYTHKIDPISRIFVKSFQGWGLIWSQTHATILSTVTICTKVPFLEQGTQEDDNTKRNQTLAMIHEQYPREAWTHVYTDGSATNVIQDGGAGIAIQHPNGFTETASAATGTQCSNCRAESEGLMNAVKM